MIPVLKERFRKEFEEIRYLDDSTLVGCKQKNLRGLPGINLNVFVSASDLGKTSVDIKVIEKQMGQTYEFGIENGNNRTPRLLKPHFATISFFYSDNITLEAEEYCRKLRPNINTNASIQIPVLVDKKANRYVVFENKPIIGMLVYPQLKQMIRSILANQ